MSQIEPTTNHNIQTHFLLFVNRSLSSTLPVDFGLKAGRTASSPDKLGLNQTASDLSFLTSVSASSLSLTDLNEQTESNPSLALIRRVKTDAHNPLNPSPHPDVSSFYWYRKDLNNKQTKMYSI